MDPDETLATARKSYGRMINPTLTLPERVEAAELAADYYHALDLWLHSAGFLPADWKHDHVQG